MHRQIMEFLRFWVDVRGSGDLPSRSRIDPLSIPRHLLPKVHLMTFDRDRRDIRYTLVGSHGLAMHGSELSGAHVADLPNRIGGSQEAYAEHIRELYRSAYRSRRPVHSRGVYRWSDGAADVVTERVTCPILAVDGTTVEYTGIQVYERAKHPALGLIDGADSYVPEFIRVLDDPDALVA